MSDWEERLKAAEADADRSQAAEQEAEAQFRKQHVHVDGDAPGALESEEFRSLMSTRHATDAAWGAWAMVMDAKPAQK